MDHPLSWRWGLLLSLLLTACSSGGNLEDARGRLQVSPTELEFPRTFVGHPTEAEILLRNTGRARLAFAVEASGPFSVAQPEGEVEGGSVHRLRVSFGPSLPGTYRERLRLRLAGQAAEVSLVGEAERPPPCRSSGPCRLVRFDPATGECVEERAEEGRPCSSGNACMVEERCVVGACVGSPRRCDDGNVCTEDFCDPERGCQSLERNDCPEPDEACRVAVCDPSAGCGVGIAEDGTPCGPTSCAGAQVCWKGSCREVEVPEGFPCGADCGVGGCSRGRCVREEGDVLSPLWRHRPEKEQRLVFPGVTDEVGNLYWLECSPPCAEETSCPPEACSLVSATAEGFERFRTPQLRGAPERMGQLLTLARSTMLLVAETSVRAFSSLDGKPLWARELEALLADALGPCPCGSEVLSLTRTGGGQVVAALETPSGAALVALGADEGAARWSKVWDGISLPAGPIADSAGNLYLARQGPGAEELVSLDLEGEERWRRPSAGRLPLAVNDAVLLVGDEGGIQALRLTDGAHRWSRGPVRAPVASLQQGYAVDAEEEGAPLVAFELVEGETTGRIPLAEGGSPGPLLLGADGRLLFLAGEPSETGLSWYLGEGQPGGGAWARRCLLPEAKLGSAPWITGPGRLTVVGEGEGLITFEAPFVELGRAGWVTPWGGPGAGRAPR